MAQMTNDKALEIISNFAEYDAEEILDAVNLLENPRELANTPALTKFYAEYEKNWEPETDYPNYDTTKQILAYDADAKQKFLKSTKQLASDFSNIVMNDNQNLSLSQHRLIQTFFDDFPQNTAQNKLNERIIKLIEDTIKDVKNFDMVGFADLKWLVDRLPAGNLQERAKTFLDNVQKNFAEENGLNIPKEKLEKNDRDINDILDEIKLYDENNNITTNYEDLKSLINRIEIVDDNNQPLSDEEKQKRLQQLFDAAKLEAYKEKISDINYLIKNKKDKIKMLSESIQKHFQTKLAITALVPDFELSQPTLEEQNDASKFKQFLSKNTKEVQKKLEKLYSQAKITLTNHGILTACSDTDLNLSAFKDRLDEAIGKKSKFSQRLNNFKASAQALWGKKYDISKKVIKNIKENRAQHIGNGIATLAMVGVSVAASKYILAASIAYGAYTAAGAAVYPIIAEASRIREDAKNKNQKINFRNSWKQAYAKLKNDKSYKDGIKVATIGAVLGGVTGGLLSKAGAGTAVAKLGVTLGRTFASTTAQTTKWISASKNFKSNPTEANRDALSAAKSSAIISIGVAGIITWFGVDNATAQNGVETLTGSNSGNINPIDGSEVSLPTDQDLNNNITTENIYNQSQIDSIKSPLPATPHTADSLTADSAKVQFQIDSLEQSLPTAQDTNQTNSGLLKRIGGRIKSIFSHDTTAQNSSFNPEDYYLHDQDSSNFVANNQIDTTTINTQIDTQTTNLENGNASLPEISAETEAPIAETEAPTTPQPGDVISTKDYGNGITKTVTMGENGVKQVSYTGLSGGIKVSENVENFYKDAIENCDKNFANQLLILQKQDSDITSISQVVENIRAQYELGHFQLPEGMSLEHAIHTAFMQALYKSDPSAIYAMSCPNGEDTVTMFSKLAFKYSTNDGVIIGYPVNETHQDKIGSISIKPGCKPQVFIQEQAEPSIVPEPEVPVAPKPILQPAPIWAPEGGGKGAQFPSAYSTNAHNPSGASVSLIDGNGDEQFTAREVHGGNGQRGFRLDGDDRIRVTATTTDSNGRTYEATQEQRIFNVANGDLYHGSPESSVTRFANALGGKPEEIIAVKDKTGNITNYVYLTKDGIEVSYDPNNNYQPSVRALNGEGIPQEKQNRAFYRAQTLMKDVFQANNVEVNSEQAPKSSLIKVAIRRGKKIVDTIFVATKSKVR